MDNFEMTKIAGAVLSALLLIFGAKTVIEMNTGPKGAAPGYSLPGFEPATEKNEAAATKEAAVKPEAAVAAKDGTAAPAAEKSEPKAAAAKATDVPKEAAAKAGATPAKVDAAAAPASGGDEVVALLAKASADNGKTIFSKCKSCHVAEKGKASTVGPNLWGVVNRAKGSYDGFTYSEGMKAKGGDWGFADLAAFIRNPKGYVQGTKMVFNGIPDAADQADVIAYLATLADTPVSLPK